MSPPPSIALTGLPLPRIRQPVSLRASREWLSTLRSGDWPDPPRGGGRALLLIPGFLAGDASLDRLNSWLRIGGFRTFRSGTTVNVDCMEPMIERMSAILNRRTEQTGARATIIGQSRGGVLGRILAARHPEMVEQLVTLGSPTVDQLSVSFGTRLSVRAVSTLGSLGVPGLFSRTCRDGACCARSRADLGGDIAPDVKYVAMFSERDEVVDWQACLDPAAEQVEIPSTHVGMAVDVKVWRELAAVL